MSSGRPGKRTAQEYYNQVWMKEHTERNGNWPIAFAEAYHAHAQQPAAPVSEAPPAQTCPTCGMDIRCIHGVLFQDKCEPCELLNKIKAWAMGAEAQTKEAD